MADEVKKYKVRLDPEAEYTVRQLASILNEAGYADDSISGKMIMEVLNYLKIPCESRFEKKVEEKKAKPVYDIENGYQTFIKKLQDNLKKEMQKKVLDDLKLKNQLKKEEEMRIEERTALEKRRQEIKSKIVQLELESLRLKKTEK